MNPLHVAASIIVVLSVCFVVFVTLYIRGLRVKNEPLGVWRYSGVTQGSRNSYSDSGVIKVPTLMTEMEALRMLSTLIPRAVVMHIDRDNFIITYKV